MNTLKSIFPLVKYLLVLFLTYTMISCEKTDTRKQVVIIGKGKYIENGCLIGIYNQATKSYEQESILLTSPNVEKTINTENVSNISITYQNATYPLYVSSGDTLIIDCQSEKCSFQGTRQNEWNFTNLLIKKGFPIIGLQEWDFGPVPYNNYLTTAIFKRNKALRLIEDSKDSLKLTKEYITLIKRDIECAFLKSFIRNHDNYALFDQSNQNKIIEFVKDYERFFLSDKDRNSYVFNYALMDWSAFIARSANGSLKEPVKSITYVELASYDYGENYLKRLKMAKHMPEPNRTDIIYSLLAFKFDTDSWNENEYETFVEYFLSISKNKERTEKIKVLSGSTFKKPDPKIASNLLEEKTILESKLLNIKGRPVSWEKILSQNKNRILYIDFWASWCKPCRQELLDSKPIVKEFQNHPNIVFISISVDENSKKWRKALDNFDMISTHQNYLVNFDSELTKVLLPDKAVPKYLIIDQKGILRTTEAPRLSTSSVLYPAKIVC